MRICNHLYSAIGVAQFKVNSMSKRYGDKAQEKVHKALHEMRHGTLTSGSSSKKVTNKKQAIAIGLSEARKMGAKVPKIPGN